MAQLILSVLVLFALNQRSYAKLMGKRKWDQNKPNNTDYGHSFLIANSDKVNKKEDEREEIFSSSTYQQRILTSCSSQAQIFETSLFITHNVGHNVSYLSEADFLFMETVIQDAYNKKTMNELCDDPFFRIISNITIDRTSAVSYEYAWNDDSWSDKGSLQKQDKPNQLRMRFDIQGHCYGCVDNTQSTFEKQAQRRSSVLFIDRNMDDNPTRMRRARTLQQNVKRQSSEKEQRSKLSLGKKKKRRKRTKGYPRNQLRNSEIFSKEGCSSRGQNEEFKMRKSNELKSESAEIGLKKTSGGSRIASPSEFRSVEVEYYSGEQSIDSKMKENYSVRIKNEERKLKRTKKGGINTTPSRNELGLERIERDYASSVDFLASSNDALTSSADDLTSSIDEVESEVPDTLDREEEITTVTPVAGEEPTNSPEDEQGWATIAPIESPTESPTIFGIPTEEGEASTASPETDGDEGGVISEHCSCNSTDFPHRSPSASEIESAINKAIVYAKNGGQSLTINSVEDVVEASKVDCKRVSKTKNFQTFSIISVIGAITEVSKEEQYLLEMTFMETYNDVIFATCDSPYFRTISKVKLIKKEVIPDLFGAVTALHFEIDGKCHSGCPTDMDLFLDNDDDENDVFGNSTRRYLTENIVGRHSIMRQVQQQQPKSSLSYSSACFCEAVNENLKTLRYGPPTAELFRATYYERIIWNQKKGLFQNLIYVAEVIEVEKVECDSNLTEFSSHVWINLQGDPHLVTESEKRSLERSFQELYDSEAFARCDQYHRTIQQVSLHLDEARIAQMSGGRRSLQQYDSTNETATTDLASVFVIHGTCRNCPVTEANTIAGSFSLFDPDAIRQRILSKQISTNSYKDLKVPHKESDTCLCPVKVAPGSESMLTKTDMITLVNDRIEDLQQGDFLNNVAEIQSSPHRVWCDPNNRNILSDAFEVDYDILVEGGLSESPEDYFEDHYMIAFEEIQGTLCDPFDRQILAISCHPIDFTSQSGRMCCETTFECTGPCQDWIFPSSNESTSMHNAIDHEYDIFNCTCLNATARAPSEEEIFERVAERFNSTLLFHTPLSTANECYRAPTIIVEFTLRYAMEETRSISYNDYQGLLQQTDTFFTGVFSKHYEYDPNKELQQFSSIIKRTSSRELSKTDKLLDVTFDANLAYSQGSKAPTPEQALAVLYKADMMDYVLNYVWHSNSIFEYTYLVSFSP